MSRKSVSKYSNVKTWIIENYLCYFCENGSYIFSPVFLDDGEFQIKLFPRGALSSCSEFISCFLEMKFKNSEIELDCKLEMTDSEGNIFASKNLRIKAFDHECDIGIVNFISVGEVLEKMAKSKYDSLIVKLHVNKLQQKVYSITEFVARTIIGIEGCFFTWYLENVSTDLRKTKTIHFPKSSEMEFKLSASETDVIITILSSDFFDNIYREEKGQDDVGTFNHLQQDEFLLCKIFFRSVEGHIYLTQKSLMVFEFKSEHYMQCCYKFKKDLLKCDENLLCGIRLSYGTSIKHIKPEEV